MLELYDCYTYTVLVTLEDYGFCGKGEGGAFVEDGKLRARRLAAVQHRRRPALVVLHVGLHAAVGGACIQARGDGGERQVPKHDVVLVSGNGGILNYHSTIVLSRSPS